MRVIGYSTKDHDMAQKQVRQNQLSPASVATLSAALSVAVLLTLAAIPGRAQDFSEVMTALVDYSKAEMEPRKSCQALGNFKTTDLVQIMAAAIPASDAAPTYCRVTGLLSPEIAFEVSLPAQWKIGRGHG